MMSAGGPLRKGIVGACKIIINVCALPRTLTWGLVVVVFGTANPSLPIALPVNRIRNITNSGARATTCVS